MLVFTVAAVAMFAREPTLVSLRNSAFTYAAALFAPVLGVVQQPLSVVAIGLIAAGFALAVTRLASVPRMGCLVALTVAWQVFGVYRFVALTGGA